LTSLVENVHLAGESLSSFHLFFAEANIGGARRLGLEPRRAGLLEVYAKVGLFGFGPQVRADELQKFCGSEALKISVIGVPATLARVSPNDNLVESEGFDEPRDCWFMVHPHLNDETMPYCSIHSGGACATDADVSLTIKEAGSVG
jgi:hypothetical protein